MNLEKLKLEALKNYVETYNVIEELKPHIVLVINAIQEYSKDLKDSDKRKAVGVFLMQFSDKIEGLEKDEK